MLLKAENIHKSFVTGTEQLDVLSGVDLELKEGEILSIVGASGSGKSTLLHILGALDRPTAGDVKVNETSFTALKQDDLDTFRNRTMGFVFQFHHLLPEFTAQENVAMPLLIDRNDMPVALEQAAAMLAQVGLAERMLHKPSELSGGEQQRVAVARALVNKPALLLADEPTGNLDNRSSAQLHELLWDLNGKTGVAVILVTHDEGLAGKAHRELRLVNGKLEKTDQ